MIVSSVRSNEALNSKGLRLHVKQGIVARPRSNEALNSKGLRHIAPGIDDAAGIKWSPEFKGIKTSPDLCPTMPQRIKWSPEFKGIKTQAGEEPFRDAAIKWSPEFKGIKTEGAYSLPLTHIMIKWSPEFKGIKTHGCPRFKSIPRSNEALNSKGLRRGFFLWCGFS